MFKSASVSPDSLRREECPGLLFRVSNSCPDTIFKMLAGLGLVALLLGVEATPVAKPIWEQYVPPSFKHCISTDNSSPS